MTKQGYDRCLQTEKGSLSYRLERKKVKNINLRIGTDGTVSVSAGRFVEEGRIESFLIEKWNFIENALETIRRRKEESRRGGEYKTGERLFFLGKEFKIRPESGKLYQVRMEGEELILVAPENSSPANREKTVKTWLRMQAKTVFSEVVKEAFQRFRGYDVPFPALSIRELKSIWGSCSPHNGSIRLNLQLIHAPRACIEYVAVHELAHFIHRDHSAKFWALVEAVMPDYRRHRAELKKYL